MALPFNESAPVRKTYFINDSERSVDPADDAGKVPQLEANGLLSKRFSQFGLNTLEDTTPSTDPQVVSFGTDGLIARASALYTKKPIGFITSTAVPKAVGLLGTPRTLYTGSATIPNLVAPAGDNRVIVVCSATVGELYSATWFGNSRTATATAIENDGTELLTSATAIGSSLTEQIFDMAVIRPSVSSDDTFIVYVFENVNQSTPFGAETANIVDNATLTQENTSAVIVMTHTSAAGVDITDARITTKVSLGDTVSGFGQFNTQETKTIVGTSTSGVRRTCGAVELNPISGNSVETFVYNRDVIAGFTGLSVGGDYYLSDTTGEISTAAGTNSYFVGVAVSSTELLIII